MYKLRVAIPPPKPTGVYANDVHVDTKKEQLVIVWNAVSGASSYRIKNLQTGHVDSRGITSITVYDGAGRSDGVLLRGVDRWHTGRTRGAS